MSVVILCDFFYNVFFFQIDGSYLFRPKSHHKTLKKLIQVKFYKVIWWANIPVLERLWQWRKKKKVGGIGSIFVPHLSAFFDTLRVLLVKLKAFLWAPKKDFTPLCSKGVKFFFATATFFFATANFFLPTVVSTSSKKKVAVPQAVLIVPTLQWSRCFASKKYVVSSYMKLTLIHGIWNRNEDFIIFC